jgi:eukaryotic-like serine/threonine-protein kinase
MWLRRDVPRNFRRFLDHTTGLIFTRKVGGSYVFIHRYLLEYFAEQYLGPKTPPELD